MFERIIEIIVFVISELRQSKDLSEINVKELESRGYTSSEISTAFSWLVDRVEFTEELFHNQSKTNPNSFRILHDTEKDMFTQAALGELIQLHSLGILSNEHIEVLIERAALTGTVRIDSRGLKSYVANSVFNQAMSPLGASRLMLDGKDSIN